MKSRTWRKIHRYLGVIIGIQLLLWTLGGVVFSWNSLERVRGEDKMRQRPDTLDLQAAQIQDLAGALGEIPEIHRSGSDLVSVTLRSMVNQPVYELQLARDGEPFYILIDAISGDRLSPIEKDAAKRIALHDFTEDASVLSTNWIDSTSAHSEYRGKHLPAYQVNLDHPSGTSIYVSANRGIVTARRNNQWRLFDFFWMLHTMDYQGRDNFNHWLLKVMSLFGLVTVLTGFILWIKTSRNFRRLKLNWRERPKNKNAR